MSPSASPSSKDLASLALEAALQLERAATGQDYEQDSVAAFVAALERLLQYRDLPDSPAAARLFPALATAARTGLRTDDRERRPLQAFGSSDLSRLHETLAGLPETAPQLLDIAKSIHQLLLQDRLHSHVLYKRPHAIYGG